MVESREHAACSTRAVRPSPTSNCSGTSKAPRGGSVTTDDGRHYGCSTAPLPSARQSSPSQHPPTRNVIARVFAAIWSGWWPRRKSGTCVSVTNR